MNIRHAFQRKHLHNRLLRYLYDYVHATSSTWSQSKGAGDLYRMPYCEVTIRLCWVGNSEIGIAEKEIAEITVGKACFAIQFGSPQCELVFETLARGGAPIATTKGAADAVTIMLKKQPRPSGEKSILRRAVRRHSSLIDTLSALGDGIKRGRATLRKTSSKLDSYIGTIGSHEFAIEFLSVDIGQKRLLKNAFASLRIDGCVFTFGPGSDGMYVIMEMLRLCDRRVASVLEREEKILNMEIRRMRSLSRPG